MKYKTYGQEMREKYPDRPWGTRPSWELQNMKKALSMLTFFNTAEEDQRLVEVTQELKLRNKGESNDNPRR